MTIWCHGGGTATSIWLESSWVVTLVKCFWRGFWKWMVFAVQIRIHTLQHFFHEAGLGLGVFGNPKNSSYFHHLVCFQQTFSRFFLAATFFKFTEASYSLLHLWRMENRSLFGLLQWLYCLVRWWCLPWNETTWGTCVYIRFAWQFHHGNWRKRQIAWILKFPSDELEVPRRSYNTSRCKSSLLWKSSA